MVIKIPEKVKLILNTLKSKGFEAYIVGGCVRDSILGIEPKDWDITTNAHPEVVRLIFSKDYDVIETGIKHGTVTVVIDKEPFEVTTYRIDGDYSDNRHPNGVSFTNNLYEDLSRRDFTINAMAYNEDTGLVDYFNGYEDLTKNKIIRTVGIPEQRFKEDALRMLRAVRFKAKLKYFVISQDTQIAIRKLVVNLKYISRERIQAELNQILIYNPDGIKDMIDLWMHVIDDTGYMHLMHNYNQNNPYHHLDLLDHSLQAVKTMDTLPLKLTMLFHDIGKIATRETDDNGISHYKGHAHKSSKEARKILQDLKYSNDIIDKVVTLIDIHDYTFGDNEKTIKKQLKRLLNQYGIEIVKDLIKVRVADVCAQNPIYLYNRLEKIYLVKSLLEEILENNEVFSRKDLNINGDDLIQLGFKGKKIGEILNNILQAVINEEIINDRDVLKTYVVDNYVEE